jgi:ketosteroid isomerase-like protein
VIDAGDRVVIRYRSRIHGQQNGIEDEVVYTQLVTFRGGKVVMLEWFLDPAEALEVAGLRE